MEQLRSCVSVRITLARTALCGTHAGSLLLQEESFEGALLRPGNGQQHQQQQQKSLLSKIEKDVCSSRRENVSKCSQGSFNHLLGGGDVKLRLAPCLPACLLARVTQHGGGARCVSGPALARTATALPTPGVVQLLPVTHAESRPITTAARRLRQR